MTDEQIKMMILDDGEIREGDFVRIIPRRMAIDPNGRPGYTEGMKAYENNIVRVRNVKTSGTVNLEGNDYNWAPRWLEKVGVRDSD